MTTEAKPSTDWFNALELSKKELEKFVERGEKIVKRYRDDRSDFGAGRKYNILWSNIRTLLPAVYAKKPRAECERRWKDKDPVGRTASEILQRALQFEIDQYPDFDATLKNSVLDRLLPGRGVAWVRYEGGEKECSTVDYVFWKDFRHSPARTWDEVTWIARRVYMSKEEGVARFGEAFDSVPMSHEPVGIEEMKREGANTDAMKKGIVWEIWDKPTRSAIWVAVGCDVLLDEKPDPLELEEFFPTPKPLFATLTTDSLVPVADYILYQDQAQEIDELTVRIGKLVEAVKVVGVYDASQTGVARMLNEGVDNTLIPVDTWAAFGEKGGLKGSVDFMPIDMVVAALRELYAAREAAKQVIYEVTGLSDIIRGSTNANETARAQEIKSQYASLRLKEMQSDVARFASDILRIKAQIMCAFYKPETLVEMSGVAQTKDAQYVPDAVALLQNDTLRSFRIEVETDSLVELDEAQEKQDRMEFLTAASGFIEKAIQAPSELAPLLGEMMMFGVRSFRAGKSMEAGLEQYIEQATEQAKQPKPQQPDPEMLKLQAAQQTEQGRMQLEQAKMQQTQQFEQFKLQATAQQTQQSAELSAQLEQFKLQHQTALAESKQAHETVLKQMELEAQAQRERDKCEMDNATKLQIAQIGAQTALDTNKTDNIGVEDLNDGAEILEAVRTLSEKVEAMVAHSQAPRSIVYKNGKAVGIDVGGVVRNISRGPDGKVIGVQ